MARYAIGDIQGCFATFLRLLTRCAFDPDVDELWIAGDLVNRGPRSADVLRWMVDHQASVTAVLGNHDLHLLRRAEGFGRDRSRDTLTDVLNAPDRDQLLAWLEDCPVLVHDQAYVMVHAGLSPAWTIEEATERANEVQALLRGPKRRAFLAAIGSPPEERAELAPSVRKALASVDVFTTLRYVDPHGQPTRAFKGAPPEAPDGYTPWFSAPERATSGLTILFGHWATLGFRRAPGIIALDSGCVWGHDLTAVRLDDGVVFQEPMADILSSPISLR